MAFQLFVRGQTGTLTIDGVRADDDVAALEAAVEAKAHVPRGHTWLGFAGRRLEPGTPVAQYGLRSGATVHLAARGRGGGCGGSKPATDGAAPNVPGTPPSKQPQAHGATDPSSIVVVTDSAAASSAGGPAFKWTSGKIGKAYTIDKAVLGEGAFAVVKKGKRKTDGATFAIKIIDKAKVEEMNDLKREVEIMSKITHPHIVRLYEVYDEPKTMHLVLELLEGGELFDRVVELGHYSEKDAARSIAMLCDALAYIHARDIVHRDLKPENILLASNADDAPIKITDFGLARSMDGGALMKTACGTPGYVAPEVLRNQGYSSGAVDMWSAGVILYVLLCGFPPFMEEELPALFQRIIEGQYDFPEPWWDDVSEEAKDFVTALLTVDPNKRLRADEVAAHSWIKSAASSTASGSHLRHVGDSLAKYQSTRKMSTREIV